MVRRILVRSLLATVLGLASAALAVASDEPKGQHITVWFSNQSLSPQVVTMTANDAVGWINYADYVGQVSFSKQDAAKMSCPSKQTTFYRREGRILSLPIRNSEMVSHCRFEPGEYDYQVDLYMDGLSESTEDSIPTSQMKGKIVVK